MLTSVPSLLKQELSKMKRGMAGLSKCLRGFLNHCWLGRKSCLLLQKSSLLSNASGSDESLYKRRSFLPPHLLWPGLPLSCRGSFSLPCIWWPGREDAPFPCAPACRAACVPPAPSPEPFSCKDLRSRGEMAWFVKDFAAKPKSNEGAGFVWL